MNRGNCEDCIYGVESTPDEQNSVLGYFAGFAERDTNEPVLNEAIDLANELFQLPRFPAVISNTVKCTHSRTKTSPLNIRPGNTNCYVEWNELGPDGMRYINRYGFEPK